jgi:hypothetical protein
MHGSPEDAVDDAISKATLERLRDAHRQLLAVRAKVEDDADLRRVLNDCFGVKVFFRRPKEAHLFADMLGKKLRFALQQREA